MNLIKLDHILIAVTDFDKSVSFYRDVLGLKQTWSSDEEQWVHLSLGNSYISIIQSNASPRDVTKSSFKHVCWQVESAENVRIELRAKGISFFPFETPVSHATYINDPEGNEIELTQYKHKDHS